MALPFASVTKSPAKTPALAAGEPSLTNSINAPCRALARKKTPILG